MDAIALFQSAYKKYWDVVADKSVPPLCEYLQYDNFDAEATALFHDLMENEYTQELLNNINQFATHTHRLAIWETVINDFSEDERFELRFEFTRMTLYYLLHQPYEFKSRLIWCSVQLCFQLGLAAGTLRPKDLVDDWKINFETLKKHASATPVEKSLVEAIEKINDEGFVSQTRNYRNRSQHQVPPRLDFGITNRIERTFGKDGSVMHSFGVAPPLTTSMMLPLLAEQSKQMIAGFHAYWGLVQEHAAKMP